ncbi:MAG: LLM class flavin-dependent oxidoreductase [Proteobacteria bacterium]|nr:LLM class flavin-dependent oxidoreductase [Pseudomonadota bacterium]
MHVDLFMEFASPPAGGRGARDVFEDGLALARAADAAGLGAVWLAEHHFLGDYCNAAAPDMLLAAMARETERIKLGFAILPLPIHDPVRVAERLATLDLLSGGRVLWGVGRGVTVTELEGFGIEPAESRAVFRQRFTELKAILDTGTWVRGGKAFELRPRPGPGLGTGWLASVSPESFDLAAELGLNVMTGPFKPWPLVKADLRRYRRLSPHGKTSFTLAVYCADDRAAARRRAGPGLLWAYRKIFEIARPLLTRQLAGYEDYRKLGWLAPLLDKTLSVAVLEAMGLAAVGDPAHVRRRLAALKASGLDRVSLVIGGGDLSVAETTRCVDLLAEQVLPALADAPDVAARRVSA